MSPKKAFNEQKKHAQRRGVEWLLSYAEWLEMWLISGKWEQRGKGQGKYVMCREGDTGPYSVRNCRIDTTENNQKERRVYSDNEAELMFEMYRRGDTQKNIGEHFGIHQSTVSKIINGERRL